jgi:hypothetical protein
VEQGQNHPSLELKPTTVAAAVRVQPVRAAQVVVETALESAILGGSIRAAVVAVVQTVTMKAAITQPEVRAAQALALFVTKAHRDSPAARSLQPMVTRFIVSPHQAS